MNTLLLKALILTVFTMPVLADDHEAKDSMEEENISPSYFPIEPDIVTNFLSIRSELGYVRVAISIMVDKPEDLLVIEHHAPLLRSAFIEIFGNQPKQKVTSQEGKEEIRRECLMVGNRLIELETGQQIIKNLLFTKYMYN
jgi:flagellar protein FliL